MKKIIFPAVFVITLSVSYYFLSFLPNQKLAENEQERQGFIFEKQTECSNICEKIYKNDLESLPETENTVLNPQYSYNIDQNACFYSGGWINFNLTHVTKRVVNCQTNEEVLTLTTIDNEVFDYYCDTCVNNAEEFEIKENEFMNN